jgi:hypothetical protein
MENNNKKVILIAVIAAILGLGGGYFLGNLTGKKSGLAEGIATGRQQILDEQLKAAQEAANPFSDVMDKANPFKDAYKNPFAQ